MLCHQEIPLKKVNQIETVTYVSAIARRWEKPLQQPADEIARCLADVLKVAQRDRQRDPLLQSLWASVQIQAAASGWLQFSLLAPGLSAWLVSLNQIPLQPDCDRIARRPPWQIQYVYGRCCSLLRRAAQQQQISFCHPQSAASYQLQAAPDLFWQLRQVGLSGLATGERALIHALIDAADGYEQLSHALAAGCLKLAYALSQAFELFYAACSPWAGTPEQRQLRLGLIRAVQAMLYRLSCPHLGALSSHL
ncbi:MAG: hypothetical protein F6J97_05070 [Leptolyngbya sp. SIO4C1]|nr:hypothetical protein [Leptolyngbya sp. SIO4C1]